MYVSSQVSKQLFCRFILSRALFCGAGTIRRFLFIIIMKSPSILTGMFIPRFLTSFPGPGPAGPGPEHRPQTETPGAQGEPGHRTPVLITTRNVNPVTNGHDTPALAATLTPMRLRAGNGAGVGRRAAERAGCCGDPLQTDLPHSMVPARACRSLDVSLCRTETVSNNAFLHSAPHLPD